MQWQRCFRRGAGLDNLRAPVWCPAADHWPWTAVTAKTGSTPQMVRNAVSSIRQFSQSSGQPTQDGVTWSQSSCAISEARMSTNPLHMAVDQSVVPALWDTPPYPLANCWSYMIVLASKFDHCDRSRRPGECPLSTGWRRSAGCEHTLRSTDLSAGPRATDAAAPCSPPVRRLKLQ